MRGLCVALLGASVGACVSASDATVSDLPHEMERAAEVIRGWATEAPCSVQGDPFCGSSCNCTTFCAGQCAINATKPQNRTLYRMTMAGVYSYAEKNTGDTAGDMSFVLSTRTRAFMCLNEPRNPLCTSVAKFAGDDPNSTDLVLQGLLEVDGQWGPYLLCNPVNVSDPLGKWSCRTDLQINPGMPLPPSCTADFKVIPGYKWNFKGKGIPLDAHTVADCCAAATKLKLVFWQFHEGNKSCETGMGLDPTTPNGEDPDGFMAYSTSILPKPCNCSRVHTTVGRQNLSNSYGLGSTVAPVGGDWFSTPAMGECADGAPLGTHGCTWKVHQTTKAIKAYCMYHTVDMAVEKLAPDCFNKCPQPGNQTSPCYLTCFFNVVADTPVPTLTAMWNTAFAQCPPVSIPPLLERRTL